MVGIFSHDSVTSSIHLGVAHLLLLLLAEPVGRERICAWEYFMSYTVPKEDGSIAYFLSLFPWQEKVLALTGLPRK